MNFYVDSGGAILGVDPEKIYQGSANANTIRFVGAFASNVKVTVAFKLPTGVWTTPQLMTASTQLAGVVTSNGVQFNVWEYSIPAVVTETFGTVNMQFYVYGDAGSGNGGLIATASSSFQVERGVPITLPDPTDDYETLLRQILSALSQIEGKLNFDDTPTIGSQNPVTSDGIAKALNTKASLQEDNTFEGYNTFQNEAYFDNAAYFDAGTFMYGMNYYLTDGPNRDDYYCYLTYSVSKILMRFWMSSNQFDIEIPQKAGTIALLSDITPIEEDVTEIKEDITNLENNKLDKKQQSSSVYGVNRNGDQYNYPVMTTALPNTVMIRDENGMAGVKKGKSGDDIANMQNIADVESEVAKKYDKTGGTIDGNVTVTGDLTVQGTTITENAETLDVKANVITTNSEGVSLINLSGLGIRTDATNVYGIMYDPQSDSVKLGLGSLDEDNNFTFNQGEGLPIAVRDDSTAFTDKHVIVWDAAGDKFVDGGKAVSDLPTLAGNNDFTGENTFEYWTYFKGIRFPDKDYNAYYAYANNQGFYAQYTDDIQYNAYKIKEAGIYYYGIGIVTNSNGIYALLFPDRAGTFALTSDIPTDYATQTALANTQRQVDGLYTLLEQKNEIYVQTASDTYTTRETAGGENIADGVQTPVKKITGKTVKTTNLMPYPYTDGMSKTVNGVTFTVNTDGAINVNGTATGFASFIFSTGADKINFIGGMTYYFSCRHGIISYLTEEGGEINYIFSDSSPSFTWGEGWIFQSIYIQLNEGQTENNLTVYPMLNEGSTALPYMPYFPGLKNAFFKEIVSTGRNLIPYPYVTKTSTIKGVTFTVNNDGTVNVNGTATDGDALFYLVSAYNLSLSEECYFSGCPAGGSSSSYLLQVYTSAPQYYSDTGSGFLVPANIDVAVVLVVRNGFTANNLVFKPMLNYGSSALPYEPYTQSVLSLPEAVELTEYDTAYPETGEIQKQSNTITFNGTETWQIYTLNEGNTQEGYTCFETILSPKSVSPENGQNSVTNNYMWSKYGYASTNSGACQSTNYLGTNIIIKQNQFNTIGEWKAHLAALSEAGNPLTVTYKTAEATTEQADFSADSYIAWKNGSETIEQGDTDNSEYGAENTVEQDYYLLTAPQEVTKE